MQVQRHAPEPCATVLWQIMLVSIRQSMLGDHQAISLLQDDLAGLSHLTALESLKLAGPAAPPCRVSAGLAAGLTPLVQLQVGCFLIKHHVCSGAGIVQNKHAFMSSVHVQLQPWWRASQHAP